MPLPGRAERAVRGRLRDLVELRPLLDEVPEQVAEGSIAEAYADIRRVLGVRMVVLVYRALAAQPGRLERAWDSLAANLAAGETQRNAASLEPPEIGAVEPLSRATLTVAGFDPSLLAGTLDGFDRANRLNLIGLTSLLTGAIGDPCADAAPAPPVAPGEMLPMADLAAVPHATLELLQRMSAPIAGPERPLVIPSLFRYFAHEPELLNAIWCSIEPAVTSHGFPTAVSAVSRRAQDLTMRLPYAITRTDDDETREIASRFVTTISAMIVTTRLLRVALRWDPSDAGGPSATR